MFKKSIAVSMRYDTFFNKKKELRNGIDFNMIKWIYNLGYDPHLIPNDLRYLSVIKKNKFSGFILSGGNDLDVRKTRIILENKILDFSKKQRIPVLGICHGAQIMNKYEGGNLKKVKNHVGKYHKLENVNQLYPVKVNSFHNYSISKLGNNFEIISKTDNGDIEAIKHKYYNWLGWMWHPEREKKFNRKLIKIAKLFFQNYENTR